MTVPEFLAWAERQPGKHFELFRGSIIAQSAEKADHARAKAATWAALQGAIRKAGLPCEAFVDGLTVVIDDETAYEPDALVNCGPRVPGDSVVATSPVIVVEVLSPSTEHIDKAVKAADYLSVASIEHVLIIDVARKAVHHYRRAGASRADVAIVRDGDLCLAPPGISVAVADLFG